MLSVINSITRKARLLDSVRCLSISSVHCSSKGSSDGSDDKKNRAKEKLNSLLQTIINDESLVKEDVKTQSSDPRPKMREKSVRERSERNLGEKLVTAADRVAQTIEGDREQNQAELLKKVVEGNEKLKKSVFNAAKSSTLSLLLTELNVEKDKKAKPRSTVDSFGKDDEGFRRADMMKSKVNYRFTRHRTGDPVQSRRIDLNEGRPLGIFNPNTEYIEHQTTTWDQCAAREMKITYTHPPRNIWEQMISWTDKGMLWKFPIDNEQGLEKEQEVSFVDHIFLDAHLEDWCPTRGPIRQFMDLVCVGLSRNHWLSAEEKKDHILWYKEYFLSKKELIKEIEAGEFVEPSQQSTVQ